MKDLQKQFKQGWDAAKEGARDIAIEAGFAEPTMLEQAKRGTNDLLKAGRKEFGASKGVMEELKEFADSIAEGVGIKEPRVGKSLVEVIKSAFGLLAAVTGNEREQKTASEKFEKACETFSKAMTALFKTKEKGHNKDTKATEAKQKPAADHQKKRDADKAGIMERQAARKGVKPNANKGFSR